MIFDQTILTEDNDTTNLFQIVATSSLVAAHAAAILDGDKPVRESATK